MSTIADYSVFTKEFLASKDVDFSKEFYTAFSQNNSLRYFAVVPLFLSPTLTTREAMNFDWSKLGSDVMWNRVSCRNAKGEFIGNIVRIQPGVREGSIRLVAKVAVPDLVTSEGGSNPADAPYNTFVLLRTDSSTTKDLPIAVATISKGYMLHRHLASGNDPLDDVENANYVSFTINNLNGYTSVDFNPDAYATYDVTDALSRRVDVLEGKEGIEGLHLAFDTASGDIKLLNKEGNVLDQANLPIKTDVIIADGEEGYKYVKTDVKQDIHAAKAWMPEGSTAWDPVEAVPYTMKHAALVVGKGSTPASKVFEISKGGESYPISTESVNISYVKINGSIYMLGDSDESTGTLFKVNGDAETPQYQVSLSGGQVTIIDGGTTGPVPDGVKYGPVEVNVITFEGTLCVLGETSNSGDSRYRILSTVNGDNKRVYGSIKTSGGSSADKVLGITPDGKTLYTFDENAEPHSEIHNISGGAVRWLDRKTFTVGPNHTLKYGLEAFVWTVKDAEAGEKIIEPFFQQLNASLLALGFHEGDDIALGTNIAILAPTEGVSPLDSVDADDYMHGETKNESGKTNKELREQEVNTQRANAKEDLVAWNAQHPVLTADRGHGTIIDHKGLDVRKGRITLGCGRVNVAEDSDSTNVNYGIQMNDHSSNLDFTVSRTTGDVQFDADGHATELTSSTLLSIEAGDYISGAPTCLILAAVGRGSSGDPEITIVRTTTGFDCVYSYDASRLTITDYRDNIAAVFNPNNSEHVPAIIEVQAIYTHPNAQSETVPAQQMHTYIGEWTIISEIESEGLDHPECRFTCNKIEEWMTAVGLADTSTSEGVKLYVVIRVY